MKLIIIIAALFSFSSFAGWQEKVKPHLPPKIKLLTIGKTDRDSARKALGKPDLARGDREYWVIDGFKYAVELTYADNKLKTIHFNFSKKVLNIGELKNDIDPKLIKSSAQSPHTTMVYEDKEGKIEIELSSGKIESVRLQ